MKAFGEGGSVWAVFLGGKMCSKTENCYSRVVIVLARSFVGGRSFWGTDVSVHGRGGGGGT